MKIKDRICFGLAVAALLFFAQWATAANVVFYVGPSGQTLYVRITNPAGNYVATALTEGSSGGEGTYYLSEATIAGLTGMGSASTGNGCAFRVFVGGTPSTTATDPMVAFGTLPWSGSAELVQPVDTRLISGATTRLTYLDALNIGGLVASASSLANVPTALLATTNGPAAVSTQLQKLDAAVSSISSASTVSPFLVSKGHTWKFDTPSQVTSPNVLTEITGFDDLLVEMDFSGALSSSASIQTINSVAIADVGGATEPTVVSSAKRADQKGVNITLDGASATAATYTVSVNVTTTDGQTMTRKGRLTVQ